VNRPDPVWYATVRSQTRGQRVTLTKKPSVTVTATVTVTTINVDLASRASIIFRHRIAVSIKTNTEHIPSLLDGADNVHFMNAFFHETC